VEGAGNTAAGVQAERPGRQPEAVSPEPPSDNHAPLDKPGAAPQAAAKTRITGAPAAARAQGEKPLASPAVRKRAWDLGIELQYVPATRPGRQLTQHDLAGYLAPGAKGAPT